MQGKEGIGKKVVMWHFRRDFRDCNGPVVKNHACNAGDTGFNP